MMQQGTGTDRPRFRQDLVAEPIDERGAKFVDVADPDGVNVFRFYEVEFSIACAMDGERDIAGIVKWAQQELGVSPSPNEVRTVIATLGELGYLDQTGAARAAATDVPLAVGVVVGAQAKPGMTNNVELGHAGARPVSPPAHPNAPSLDLGAPGAASARAYAPAEDIPLGAPGRGDREAPADIDVQSSDVSLDLSDHIAVRRDDVKEAVRQSKVMSAVDVPKDLMDALEPPPVEMVPRPIEKLPARPQPLERAAEAKAPVVAKPFEKRPVELPKVPEKRPTAPTAPTRGVSWVLIVLFILVVVGAGAFFVWKYVIDQSNQSDIAGNVTTMPATPAPVTPEMQPAVPPPPEALTTTIAFVAPKPKTILAMFAGTIEWLEATEKDVKSNHVIMKLQGYKPLEALIDTIKKDIAKRTDELKALQKARDDAQAAGNEAAVKAAETKITTAEKGLSDRRDLQDKKIDELEPLLVRLIIDGHLTISAKVGQRVPENTPIATVQQPNEPSATFKVKRGFKLELGVAQAVKLGEKLVTCVVADWEPEKIRLGCPQTPGLVDGAQVSWMPN